MVDRTFCKINSAVALMLVSVLLTYYLTLLPSWADLQYLTFAAMLSASRCLNTHNVNIRNA